MSTTRNSRGRKTIAAEVSTETQATESVTAVVNPTTETQKPAAKKTTTRKRTTTKKTTASRAKTTEKKTQTSDVTDNAATIPETIQTDPVTENMATNNDSVAQIAADMAESVVASHEAINKAVTNSVEQTQEATANVIETQTAAIKNTSASMAEQIEVLSDENTTQNWLALGQELHNISTSTASRLLQYQMNLVQLSMEQGAQQLNLLSDVKNMPSAMQTEMDLLLQTQQQLFNQAQNSMQAMVDFHHDMQVWLGKTVQLAQTDVPNPLQYLKK